MSSRFRSVKGWNEARRGSIGRAAKGDGMQRRLVPEADLRDPGDPDASSRHLALLVAAGFEAPRRQLDADHRAMGRHGWRYWIPDADERLSRLGRDRPALLFVAGSPDPGLPAVGVVGTRRPDAYGEAMTTALGAALGGAGATLVSGGALGIDRLAHVSALDAGGPTVIVLGGGLARPHPAGNRDLFRRAVAAGSCVLSEWPPGFTPARFTFPRRNRLIAALSDALVVVQAGASSGALITADRAQRAGVPCFAVPGDAWYERSAGALSLLATGRAVALRAVGDLAGVPGLEALARAPWPRLGHRAWGLPNPWRAPGPATRPPDDETARAVLEVLAAGPLDFDELARRSGVAAGTLAAKLVDLEVTGVVVRLAGGCVARPSGA